MFYGGFRPYVSAAEKRKRAARHAAKLRKQGRVVRPVRIEGRTIAHSFWGKAWCDNLESYSDYANRMPRGRTYSRNGSIVDLSIEPGRVTAIVSGSEIYEVEIGIDRLDRKQWKALVRECTGRIGSMVELLQGKFSDEVMQTLARPKTGLFPSPREIRLSCSCPDWAEMCKHVAAALYGVGIRLEEKPELLFHLRGVDHTELVGSAADAVPARTAGAKGRKIIEGADLSALFGIELESPPADPSSPETHPNPSPAKPRKRSASGGKSRRPSRGR